MIGVKITRGNDELIDSMDTLAKAMITETDTAGISNKIDVFSAVTKWIAVKNRLNLSEDDGAKINAYRDALADTPAPGAIHRTRDARSPASNTFRNPEVRARAAAARGKRVNAGDGGATLDSIKSRLPHTDGGDDLGNGDDAFRPVSPPPRGGRRVHAGADDGAEPGLDEDHGKPDL